MLFTLKKYIGGMMLPLPLLLLIIALGLGLVWFSRFQKSGKTLITFGWLVLLLLSLQPVADKLLRPIENTYPTWQGNQKVEYIVVLGGGYTWDPNWAPSSNLINNSLPRLNEGIRLWLANPGSKMIFTGAPAKTNPVSTAEAGAGGGIPRRAALRYYHARQSERYRRRSRRGETGYWRCSVLTGDICFTSAKGNDFLRKTRSAPASRAGEPDGH